MNNTWIVVLGGFVSALIVGQIAWAARQLVRHAEILAVVTTEIKEIPSLKKQVEGISVQVTDVRLEQARVKAELAKRSRPRTA